MNYEKVPDEDIGWVKFSQNAFREAQEDYARHGKVDFADELLDYLNNAFVVSRPHLFALARPIEFKGKRGWFIRYARGDLLELLTVLPCPMEYIAFCRDGDGIIRVVNWEVFVKKCLARKGLKLCMNENAA